MELDVEHSVSASKHYTVPTIIVTTLSHQIEKYNFV